MRPFANPVKGATRAGVPGLAASDAYRRANYARFVYTRMLFPESEDTSNARPCDPRRRGCGLFQHTRCFSRREDPAGADYNTKCRYSFHGTFIPCYFNCYELHDVVQLTVGELPNELRHSGAAAGVAFWNRDFERDGEPDLHGSLQFVAACMSDELRPAIPVAINKSQAALVHTT